MNNPVRVAEKQRKYIKFLPGRYTPVLSDRVIGVNFLYDSQPNEGGDFLYVFNNKNQKKAEVGKPLGNIPEEPHIEEDNLMPP